MTFRSSIVVPSSIVDAPALPQAFSRVAAADPRGGRQSRQDARDLRGLAGSDRLERYYTVSGPSRVDARRTRRCPGGAAVPLMMHEHLSNSGASATAASTPALDGACCGPVTARLASQHGCDLDRFGRGGPHD